MLVVSKEKELTLWGGGGKEGLVKRKKQQNKTTTTTTTTKRDSANTPLPGTHAPLPSQKKQPKENTTTKDYQTILNSLRLMAFQIPTSSLNFPLKNPFTTFNAWHFTHHTFCWCRSQRILVPPDEQRGLQEDFHRLQCKDKKQQQLLKSQSSLDITSCGVTSGDALYALTMMMMMMMWRRRAWPSGRALDL